MYTGSADLPIAAVGHIIERMNPENRTQYRTMPTAAFQTDPCYAMKHDAGDDGLHFLTDGYEQIGNVIFASITNGLTLSAP